MPSNRSLHHGPAVLETAERIGAEVPTGELGPSTVASDVPDREHGS